MATDKQKYKSKRDFSGRTDEYILGVVLEDVQQSESYQASAFQKFREYYKLYRSHIDNHKLRDNGSNLFIPYTFHIIETVTPKIVNTMFYTRPYVQTVPLGVPDAERSTKAEKMNKLLDYQFSQKMSIVPLVTDVVKSTLMFGTAITKQVWEYQTKEVKRREPAQFLGMRLNSLLREVTVEEIVKDQPKMTLIPILDFLFDPSGTSIEDCRYCVHKYTEDLSEIYRQSQEAAGMFKNIDKLETAASTGASPNMTAGMGESSPKQNKEIEILEYWTDDYVVRVANRDTVIMVQENPFYHMKKPFAKWVDTPVPNEFYGIGQIEPLVHLQHELNTTRNQRIDSNSFAINRMWKKLRGSSVSDDQLVSRPNGVIEVDDMNDLQEIPVKHITVGFEEEKAVKDDIDRTSGVHDSARGSNPVRRETATTMSILSNASSERFQLKVLLITDGGLKDAVSQIIQLNQQYIDRDTEVLISGEDNTMELTVLEPYEILGEYEIMAVGSAVEPSLNKEVRQNQMIQLLNVLYQNPMVNQEELLRRLFAVFEFKNIDALIAPPTMDGGFLPIGNEAEMGGISPEMVLGMMTGGQANDGF